LPPSSAPFTFSACNADAAKTAKAAEPTTEEQKTLYALGIFMSQQVDVFALTPEELAMVQKGLADGVAHNKPVVDTETYKPKLQALAQTRIEAASKKAAEAGTAYLEKAAKEAGATKTASGIVIKHTKEGTGASPRHRPGEGALRRSPHRRQGVRQLHRAREPATSR
jgi:FKBP-type peptidyl-prolyl cis-trans isomerase FkpA